MPAPTPASARIVELDGLRGCAIALILWHHLGENFLPPGSESWLGWLRAASNLSWCGVDLFFVLSGFFIGGILIDQRHSPRLARVFYLRRAVRILPLYYLTLAAALLAVAAGTPGSWQQFPTWVYATFLTNFYLVAHQAWDWLPLSVLWSLAIEEQFYLAAPWLVRALRPGALPWLAGGLVLTALLLRVLSSLVYPDNHFAVHLLMPMRMDALALGAWVAWLVRQDAGSAVRVHLSRHWRRWSGLGLLALAGLTLLRPAEGSTPLAWGGYTLLAAAFALAVAVVAVVRPAGLNRVLGWRPLVLLGRHSYFLYLWHGLLGLSMIRWWGGPDFLLNSLPAVGLVLAAIGVTWLAAGLSARFLEGPFIRWGHRHRY